MKHAVIATVALALAGCTNMATLGDKAAAPTDRTKLDEPNRLA